jgi:peptidyl-prolyl cis-trans isomerase D
MALITKIREKSGIAAAAIAVSLILFLLGSDIFQGKSRFFGGSSDEVGKSLESLSNFKIFRKSRRGISSLFSSNRSWTKRARVSDDA